MEKNKVNVRARSGFYSLPDHAVAQSGIILSEIMLFYDHFIRQVLILMRCPLPSCLKHAGPAWNLQHSLHKHSQPVYHKCEGAQTVNVWVIPEPSPQVCAGMKLPSSSPHVA